MLTSLTSPPQTKNLKKATIPRRLRLALTAISAVVVAATAAGPAKATLWYPSPPTCQTTTRPINVGTNRNPQWFLYAYAYRYTTRYASSQGVAYTTHYVYNVQNVLYPYGLVTVGRADKICGQIVR